MTRLVDGRWLSPAEAFARFVFEDDPATGALDHESQSNLVDLLAEFLRGRGAPER